MNEYKLTASIEPTDDYKRARADLFKALESINKLDSYQQQMLMKEVFHSAMSITIFNMISSCFK